MSKASDFVIYKTATGQRMRAKVCKRTRNGWLTVEPFFFLDENGKSVGTFQGGYKLTLRSTQVVR